jgi:hypothetical protein
MLISRIYHSREDRVADLHDSNEQLNYDGHDGERLTDVADVVDDLVGKFCEALDKYVESEDDDELEYNRRNAIERWALAQAALSKAAWVMRLDGNVAYERMINALKDGSAADMRGL